MAEVEITVEAALAELQEMFPLGLITIEVNSHEKEMPFWFVRISARQQVSPPSGFLGVSLADCMAQVRAWKDSQ